MKRRSLLAATVAATTASIAGCLGGGPGTDPENGDEDDATPTSTPKPDGPRLVDQSFEVKRVDCGNDYGDHDVTTDDGVVTVEGVLDGRNTCYSAELVTSEYDAAADELYVEIESVASEDREACATCIVEIEYVATFTFEGGEPSSIRVDQRGSTTGSSSASQSVSDSNSGTKHDATETPADDA